MSGGFDGSASHAARTWAARSSRWAAPGYTVSVPLGVRERVRSPPPTSTAEPGSDPFTTVVVARWSGPSTESAAADVSTFMTLAVRDEVVPPRS